MIDRSIGPCLVPSGASLYVAALILVAAFTVLASPNPARANDPVGDAINREADPRFDIERYTKSYNQTMKALDAILKKGCIDPANSVERDNWVAYAKTLSRLLFEFASYVEYSEPGVHPALTQRQEALDLTSKLQEKYQKVEALKPCPSQAATETTPPIPSVAESELGDEKCATDDEVVLIQSYRRSIEGLKRELDTLEKPFKEADEEAKAAEEQSEKLWSDSIDAAGSVDNIDDATWAKIKIANSAALRLRMAATEKYHEIEVRKKEIERHIKQERDELDELLEKIHARDCPPPRTVITPPAAPGASFNPPPPPEPPKKEPEKLKDKGNTSGPLDFLGNVSIGIGGGRHHEDPRDNRSHHGHEKDKRKDQQDDQLKKSDHNNLSHEPDDQGQKNNEASPPQN